MAELTSFKQQFDDQLTCCVCLDQYTDPKMLPCYHTFCLECIKNLQTMKENGEDYISCPTCRVVHLLPEEGGNIKLPNDFKINSLLELRKSLHASQNTAISTICLKHNDPLKVYCETCHQVICRDCTISKEHNTHDYRLISECYPKHHQQLQEGLHQIHQKIVNIDLAISHLDAREDEVLQQGERLTEKVNTHAQKMIDHIERSRIRLSLQLDGIVQQKTRTLKSQKQQAHKMRSQLKICQEIIEHNLDKWNQHQILVEKHKMMNKMENVSQNVNSTIIEEANIEFTKADFIQTEIGTITSKTYGKATLKIPPCFPKEVSTATLSLRSHPDGSPFHFPSSLISSALSPPNDDKISVKCNVTQTNPGEYNITFTPNRGEHLLTVQVGGFEIPNSPFILPVLPIGDKPVMTIDCVMDPKGIAVCANGNIVVAEYGGNCVTIFNKQGVKIKSIKKAKPIQFDCPYGVAISNDGHILVTDYHKLHKLTPDGVCVESSGSNRWNRGQLKFGWPRGIAVHPATGIVFFADFGNNRIQAFNGADLFFSHTIKHENLQMPCDVAVDSKGYLYAMDAFTHNVCKFTTTGRYIQNIAKIKNSGATFMTIHNEYIYVVDSRNHRVMIFDVSGNELHSFGKRGDAEGKLNEPAGITVDALGYVYVCDSRNNRVVVY